MATPRRPRGSSPNQKLPVLQEDRKLMQMQIIEAFEK